MLARAWGFESPLRHPPASQVAYCDYTHIFAAAAALCFHFGAAALWFRKFRPSFAHRCIRQGLLFPAELFQNGMQRMESLGDPDCPGLVNKFLTRCDGYVRRVRHDEIADAVG